jgi:hypothetical protein
VSYIAFDLDALNVCPQVGAACGMSAAEAAHGLLQLWAWCFRSETDAVTDTHLRGFFSGRDAGAALDAFGFVERSEGGWRVRGAARYLRIKQAQRDGGRKGARNLRQGKKKASPPKVEPRVDPEVDLRVDLRSTSGSTSSASPALTPNTEHRTPNTESKSIAPREKRAPPPRETDCIGEDFEAAGLGKYAWQGAKDGTAWALLRAHSEVVEIRARWRFGLKADGWLRVATVAQLHSKWNDLGVAMKRPATAPARDAPQTYSDGYYVEPAT